MKKKIKVGIIGCGTIGKEIVKAAQTTLADDITIISLCDIDDKKRSALARYAKKNIGTAALDELFRKSDLVIEAASGLVAPKILELAVKKKKSIMIMSVGGLLGKEKLLKEAEKKGVKVYLPSGALAGIDALKAGALGKIHAVTLTTKKSPEGLNGAPYLIKNNVNLKKLKKETIVFEGTAEAAVNGFPKNINVSAILSLAGIGSKKTHVRIAAVPGSKKNVHELEIKGDFGAIRTVTENVPSPGNPKTSYLAALSAIATLKGVVSNVRFGT